MQRPHLAPMPQRLAKSQPQSALRQPITLLLVSGLAAALLALTSLAALLLGLGVVMHSGRILPAVAVGGVPVGGLSESEAVRALSVAWQVIALRDGERVWSVPAAQLGMALDAEATAQQAVRYGRQEGSALLGLFGQVNVPPIFQLDPSRAAQGLAQLAALVEYPPRNVTIRLQGNVLVAVPPVSGRALQVGETLSRLAQPDELADGYFDLVMREVPPEVTDAAPLLARAAALFSAPLRLTLYNPVSDQSLTWEIPPNMWIDWLVIHNTEHGTVFGLAQAPLEAYLNEQNAALGGAQYIKADEAAAALQAALQQERTEAQARLYNAPTQYTVQMGDTLGSIAWQHGIQMFRIQRANPHVNLQALRVGQVITIPSKDELLPLPVVPNKRVLISIARQRMWVYENRQLKWEWSVSTGISSSPTQHGVYQVLSHEGTAYASSWNLYMPYFLSIYEAVPGFFNGIHGFPLRGGAQVLWENALGRPVTYGCILLSTANAQALYAWAEDGVVVEIQP
ncbi:MAG: L,D-transpeptidase family protein [Aggregatilineales bacterium]